MPFAKYPLIIFLSSLTPFVFSATTVGPLAPVSIHKQPSYSSAKPCAAKCLVYQGVWNCGVNAGYHDLGSDLGCGCSPNNACWCGADLQVSATSYISSCVSAGCGTSGNAEGEVKNMLGLYSGYCATANVEISTSRAASVVTTGAAVATTGVATRASNSAEASVTATAARETSTITAEKEEKKEDGLSKSDIIALGTGLGVGIPSLLVAIIALWIQIRKKRDAKAAIIKVESDVGQTQPAYAPSPPPLYAKNELSAQNEVPKPGHVEVHELDSRGGRR